MTRSEAERHAEDIMTILGEQWRRPDGPAHYGVIDIVEKNEAFQVAYRNSDIGFWWDLTNADAALAAAAVHRWDSPNYRRLRPSFEGLLSVSDCVWEEPQLDRVRITNEPSGMLSIDEVSSNEYRLVWRPINSTSAPVDLSALDVEGAITVAFGPRALEDYRELHACDS